MKRHGLAFAAAISLLALPFTGAAEHLPIKNYTGAEGLPGSDVTRIRQDSRGFLWMIAGDGISRFDGYTSTNYTTDDGLPDRRVNDLLETRSGVYWVATESGLARFNPMGVRRGRGSAPTVPMFVPITPGGNRGPVAFAALAEDDRGIIWCGGPEGLYRMEVSSNGSVRLQPFDLGTKNGENVTVLRKDGKGFLWIGSRSGVLYRITPRGGVERYTGRNGIPAGQFIMSMAEAADGGFWLGTWEGLYRLVAEPDPARPIVARQYTARDGLPSAWVTSLLQTRDGKLWVGTTGGLCRPVDSRDGPAQNPACGGAVNQPVSADAVDRAVHFVIGVPKCDS